MQAKFKTREFRTALKAHLLSCNVSLRAASLQCGVSIAAISTAQNRTLPSLLVYAKLCSWMGRGMEEFIIIRK